MRKLTRCLFVFALAWPLLALAQPHPTTVATMRITGKPELVRVARDLLDAQFAADPSLASQAGLFEDAVRAPSFTPQAVQKMNERVSRDLKEMRAMPWRTWPVDEQIDFRYLYAQGQALLQTLSEKPFVHRPATWLEPFANNLVSFYSYAPEEKAKIQSLWAKLPAMLDEVRKISTAPTRRDVETADAVVEALIGMAERDGGREARAAIAPISGYRAALKAMKPAKEFTVIGRESYAWRYKHALLLPYTPDELLAMAHAEIRDIDAALQKMGAPASRPVPPADPTLSDAARALTKASLLKLYDDLEVSLRDAVKKAGIVTISDAIGPIHARETPDAMVPLTGDGGSMNPPPTFVASNVGYWNVEHFKPEWTLEERLAKVSTVKNHEMTGYGAYAAHEGFPGHHLQLAVARLNPDPLRSVIGDSVLTEGWAMYAESELGDSGIFATPAGKAALLRSWRMRAARVVYDVNLETGAWTLEQAADFKFQKDPARRKIDPDILRAVNWPTQLVCYFAGRKQLFALRDAYKKKMGAAYSERAFNDAVLAEGSIPVTLIRAKLLGEPLPDL